jgi:hypothetical protein
MTGYESKRAAAQDKLHEIYDDMYVVYLNGVYDGKKQRPWVGLTEEEAQWLYDNCRTPSNLIEMVEAKLKEKNND